MTDDGSVGEAPSLLDAVGLSKRPYRAPDYQLESRALGKLAAELGERPESLLQSLTDLIVDEGVAGSAGVSILDSGDATERHFRWEALSGAWAAYKGGGMPYDASPCGLVISRDEMLLIRHPEALFPDGALLPRIQELLLVPFRVEGKPAGTLWIVGHDGARPFDSEDGRLLSSLADMAAAGYRMSGVISGARKAEQSSHERYEALFKSIDQGFCVIEMLEDGDPPRIDYRLLETNPAFVRQTGITNAIGCRMRELVPTHEEFWFQTYEQIALTGKPRRFEHAAEGLQRWYDVFAFRVGRPEQKRVAVLFNDIKPRKQAEAAIRRSEKKFRALATAGSYSIYRMSPDWRQMYELKGADFLADTRAPVDDWWNRYILPEDRDVVRAAIDAAIRDQTTFELEHRVRRLDGTIGWTSSRAVPIRDDAGQITEWFGAAADVTGRYEALEKQRQSEERLRQFGDASQDVLWIRRADTLQWQCLTPAFEVIYGLSRAEALLGDNFRTWLDLIVPEDRAHAEMMIDRVRLGEHVSFEFRIQRPSDGSIRWLRNTDFPIRDGPGPITLIGGIGHDVTSIKDAQRHQQVLLAELQHRVRNTLAIVRSIVRRTAETTQSAEDMASHLQGRLAAFSRVQAAVTRTADGGVDLSNLIEDELLAHAARESASVEVRGPKVLFRPRPAETLSLAIHELTSNAVKYGALGVEGAKLSVSWTRESRDDELRLHLAWVEHGLRLEGKRPQRLGFGLELLERTLPYELGATTRSEFTPDGFHFTLEMPLGDHLAEG